MFVKSQSTPQLDYRKEKKVFTTVAVSPQKAAVEKKGRRKVTWSVGEVGGEEKPLMPQTYE
jgi:hypothetical protein